MLFQIYTIVLGDLEQTQYYQNIAEKLRHFKNEDEFIQIHGQ